MNARPNRKSPSHLCIIYSHKSKRLKLEHTLDMSLQQVETKNHSLCTGQATSSCNRSGPQRYVSPRNRHVCRIASHKTQTSLSLCGLSRRQKRVACRANKGFHKKLSSTKPFLCCNICRDLSPRVLTNA